MTNRNPLFDLIDSRLADWERETAAKIDAEHASDIAALEHAHALAVMLTEDAEVGITLPVSICDVAESVAGFPYRREIDEDTPDEYDLLDEQNSNYNRDIEASIGRYK